MRETAIFVVQFSFRLKVTVKTFFSNYRTSLFGIMGAIANLGANGTSLRNLGVSSAIALLGLFAQDANGRPAALPPVVPPTIDAGTSPLLVK